MGFENVTYGIPLVFYLLILLAIFVPMALILCNPLIAGLLSSVLVVACCELGKSYGWLVGGGTLSLLFVFLWALLVARYSSR